MNEDQRDLAALKEAYRLWQETKGQSVDHWLSLMTDDVKFRSLAEGAQTMEFTRLSTCKQDVRSYFTGLSADWEMIFYHVDEYISQGDRIVALGHCSFKNKRTGKVLETPKADFHRFRDGKICEFFELYDTARTIAAATTP